MTLNPQEQLLREVFEDLYERANDDQIGGLRLGALTQLLLNLMEESGVISEPQAAFYIFDKANVRAEVHGYACDTDDDVLYLFFVVDANEATPLDATPEVQFIQKSAIDRAFKRLQGFVKLAQKGELEQLDESQPAWELAELVRESVKANRSIALHVLTTGQVSEKAAAGTTDIGTEVWDLERLGRLRAGQGDQSINVDFQSDFGGALPCLVTKTSDELQVLLATIPGQVLANLYNLHRSRLLERNVRSFLQFTGKVNQGIRDTILNEPKHFLSFNNGLSATASSVELKQEGAGLARILKAADFQIVNGGQTTASVAACARRDSADLSAVTVAMKLTVVPANRIDDMVPLISQFANTQNRIQQADFSANDPWHVELEKLSRNIWTQPEDDAPRGTRWFYERSRGQYRDAVAAAETPATRKRFRRENPSSRKFEKTDVGKFIFSWDQRPEVVSRGGQKCFVEFMKQLHREKRPIPNEEQFRQVVAFGILFRTCEKLYGELGYTGYRANVVTYSVALLSRMLERRLPWGDIWKDQQLPATLVGPLKTIVRGVRDVIVQPPSNQNVTEWCKKPECWTRVLEANIDPGLPKTEGWQALAQDGGGTVQTDPTERRIIDGVASVPSEVWYDLSKWAKDTQSLQAWQRRLCFSLGTLAARKRPPSYKQAVQGRKALIQARALGFGHLELTDIILKNLAEVDLSV